MKVSAAGGNKNRRRTEAAAGFLLGGGAPFKQGGGGRPREEITFEQSPEQSESQEKTFQVDREKSKCKGREPVRMSVEMQS